MCANQMNWSQIKCSKTKPIRVVNKSKAVEATAAALKKCAMAKQEKNMKKQDTQREKEIAHVLFMRSI